MLILKSFNRNQFEDNICTPQSYLHLKKIAKISPKSGINTKKINNSQLTQYGTTGNIRYQR